MATDLTTYPVNDVLYDAADAELFHCTRTSGVFMGDDFNANATGNDLTVTVQPGLAWIRNEKFAGKAAALREESTLTFSTSNSTYGRYDAIVLQFAKATGKTVLGIKQGTASSTPQRPAVVRTSGTYELHLFHVYRGAGTAVITQSNIEDMRGNTDYCGYMVDDVSAFDEGKFLAKASYDPNGTILNAGGLIQYIDKNYIPSTAKGNRNGVASLGSDGKLLNSQISASNRCFVVKYNNGNPDKTYDQILSAYNEGKSVYLYFSENSSLILTGFRDDVAYFSSYTSELRDDNFLYAEIAKDGTNDSRMRTMGPTVLYAEAVDGNFQVKKHLTDVIFTRLKMKLPFDAILRVNNKQYFFQTATADSLHFNHIRYVTGENNATVVAVIEQALVSDSGRVYFSNIVLNGTLRT